MSELLIFHPHQMSLGSTESPILTKTLPSPSSWRSALKVNKRTKWITSVIINKSQPALRHACITSISQYILVDPILRVKTKGVLQWPILETCDWTKKGCFCLLAKSSQCGASVCAFGFTHCPKYFQNATINGLLEHSQLEKGYRKS